MLRITTKADATGTIFELEGKLTGAWVEELRNCWEQAALANQRLTITLKAVTFIDDPGRALLAEIYRSGAELTGEGCMTKEIIERIVRAG
jgi:anti-anti-sigma regulatory factor